MAAEIALGDWVVGYIDGKDFPLSRAPEVKYP
jgi:hypothetical protein